MSGLTNARRRAPFAFDLEQPAPLTLARLPNGRHQLSRDFVEQNQRNRLMAGAIDAVGARGYLASTVAAITKAAGLSSNTFYVYYADKRACFLDAYDVVVAWLEEEGQGAVAGTEDWAAAVKAAVESTLALLAADPRLAHLVTVEIFLAGPAAAARHRLIVDRLSEPLRAGRAEGSVGRARSANLEPTLIGGAISLIARYVDAGDGERLGELAPEIVEFLLLPYLGAEAAKREAGGRD